MAKLVFSGSLSPHEVGMLSAYAQGLLTGAAERASLERIIVTSTIRTPRSQAEAMYRNIASGRYIRYKKAGQQVTDLCVRMLAKNAPKEETIAKMEALIEGLAEKGEKVSLHCVSEEQYAQRNIVDISRSMAFGEAERLLKQLSELDAVERIIQPIASTFNIAKVSFDSAEAAIHIEISIPEKYRV